MLPSMSKRKTSAVQPRVLDPAPAAAELRAILTQPDSPPIERRRSLPNGLGQLPSDPDKLVDALPDNLKPHGLFGPLPTGPNALVDAVLGPDPLRLWRLTIPGFVEPKPGPPPSPQRPLEARRSRPGRPSSFDDFERWLAAQRHPLTTRARREALEQFKCDKRTLQRWLKKAKLRQN
jgi:hypothetical protein